VTLGCGEELRGRIPSACDQHTRYIVTEGRLKSVRPGVAGQALEIAHFTLAKDENALRLQVFVKSCEGEAGLLDMGARDHTVKPGATA
jgi:hypothetical protein